MKTESPYADEIRNSTFDLFDLPETIQIELVEYLNKEYGSPMASDPLSIEDLTYEGEFSMYGKPIRYWKYPCKEENGCWVTVQPFGNSYLVSMAFELPSVV